jgi:chromosome segregation ATPase
VSDTASIEEIRQEVHDIRAEQIAQGRQLARHDEAISGLKEGHARLLVKMDDLRRQLRDGVDGLHVDLRGEFAELHERLDRVAYRQGEDDGAAQQRQAQRSWTGIAVAGATALLATLVAVAGWWLG